MADTSRCLHCSIIRAISAHFHANPDQLDDGKIESAHVITALMTCVGDVVTTGPSEVVPANIIVAMAAFQNAINGRMGSGDEGTRH